MKSGMNRILIDSICYSNSQKYRVFQFCLLNHTIINYSHIDKEIPSNLQFYKIEK